MRLPLLLLFLFAATLASAAVTPLPGATPQQAPVGQFFPNPIRVQVTTAAGQPVPNASVRWAVMSPLQMEGSPHCFPDLGQNCDTTADANGVATLPRMKATAAGRFTVAVFFDGANQTTSRADIVLEALPFVTPASLQVASGAGQRAVIRTGFVQRFRVRALRNDGSPLEGVKVTFSVDIGLPSGSFDPPLITGTNTAPVPDRSIATTDALGYAESAAFIAGWGLGTGQVTAQLFDANSSSYAETKIAFTNMNADGTLFTSFQDMWWAGSVENGWGMAVMQKGEQLFNVIFAYDAAGNPTWLVQSGGVWVSGLGSNYIGRLDTPTGSPYFAYDPGRFKIGDFYSFGDISFKGPAAGVITGSFTGSQGPQLTLMVKQVQRFDFSTNSVSPIQGVGGMWWGGSSQAGWGISILEQKGGLFVTWFTYDAQGKATWFFMPSGSWADGATWRGTIYRATSSPWVGQGYDPSKLQVTAVGTFELRFAGTAAATFQYTAEGHQGTLALERYPF
jgi:hypothetical protein